jgi:hypothetical protein
MNFIIKIQIAKLSNLPKAAWYIVLSLLVQTCKKNKVNLNPSLPPIAPESQICLGCMYVCVQYSILMLPALAV